jgi:hypothetical protein
MGSTAVHGYPYPEGSDQPQVHLDVKALADDIDQDTFVPCTSATRPGHFPGRRIFETDTKATLVSDGSAWLPTVARCHARLIHDGNGYPPGVSTGFAGAGMPTLASAATPAGTWSPAVSGVSVPLPGLYAATFYLTVTAALAGRSFLSILVGGLEVGRAGIMAGEDTGSVTAVGFAMTQGQVVSANLFHSSGGNRDISASALRVTRLSN